MNDMVWIAVWSVIAVAIFIWLWQAGHIVRLRAYVRQTQEELKKCSWPTWDELKGSTVVVFIAIAVLGIFTVAVDQLFFQVFRFFRI